MKVKIILEYNEETINEFLKSSKLETVDEVKAYFKGSANMIMEGNDAFDNVTIEVSE